MGKINLSSLEGKEIEEVTAEDLAAIAGGKAEFGQYRILKVYDPAGTIGVGGIGKHTKPGEGSSIGVGGIGKHDGGSGPGVGGIGKTTDD
jgi:hypothetical protein